MSGWWRILYADSVVRLRGAGMALTALVALGMLWVGRGALSPRAHLRIRGSAAQSHRMRASSGILHLLTYNVAGLPAGLSAAAPQTNTARMSPLLNDYDLVLTQEDFGYHPLLVGDAEHSHQWGPRPAKWALVGDGLSILSSHALTGVARSSWQSCYGYLLALSDCLSEKGFALARLHLDQGHSVDVYNVHADAGTAAGDIAARHDQFEQLAHFIARESHQRPLIVAGDTNAEAQSDLPVLERFLDRSGLRDVCGDLHCPREVDRVFLRSTPNLVLTAIDWEHDARFVDSAGQPLSDHPALAVRVEWRATVDAPRG